MKTPEKKNNKGLLGTVQNKKTKRASNRTYRTTMWARKGLKNLLQKGGL